MHKAATDAAQALRHDGKSQIAAESEGQIEATAEEESASDSEAPAVEEFTPLRAVGPLYFLVIFLNILLTERVDSKDGQRTQPTALVK